MNDVIPRSEETIPPEKIALQQMVEKNLWLIRIRWFYPFFALIFFLAFNYYSRNVLFGWRNTLIIFCLPFIGNLIFYYGLKTWKNTDLPVEDFTKLKSYASLQLDFDLVFLSSTLFLTGGLESPVTGLFIFYILVSTFLIDYHKAFRNTLLSIVMLIVIFMAYSPGLEMTGPQLTRLFAIEALFVFTFAISGYLSKNMRRNDQLLQELLQQAHRLSITDGLTELFNQSHFFAMLHQETEKSLRYNHAFSLIIFDVDFFKNFNDHNGHILGSQTLRKIGLLMKNHFRSTDILAKYGGDEFVIILPHTDKVGAYLAAERLREVVERESFIGALTQPEGKITLSLGIASLPEHGTDKGEILDRADKALYFAKKTGRNRTIIYQRDIVEETEMDIE